MEITAEKDYPAFAAQCRGLLAREVSPEQIHWSDPYDAAGGDLFSLPGDAPSIPAAAVPPAAPGAPRVPADFVKLAQEVFCHTSPHRFHYIYSALWRITRGERHLLEVITDDTVYELMMLRKQVARDLHKMHAFVRFRKVQHGNEDWYIAWHRPDYHIVRPAAPFFRDRFRPMLWTILTPDESVSWNRHELTYSAGVAADPIEGDALEDLWQTYYASTFNPARANVAVMKTHMPRRYWESMPETRLIPDLVKASADRTSAMLSVDGATALDFIPENASIDALRTAAQACRGCPLYHNTHHAVCSEGPATAALVLVGEQPGDQEDLQGRPFVGPSGAVLDRALAGAGIPRRALYITESVKHFKHEIAGRRRIHRSPNSVDIAACRPWLMAELQVVQPAVIVCLGATAAQSVLGKKVALRDVRDEIIETPLCRQTIITTHPAAILRQPDPAAADQAFLQLQADLARAWALTHPTL